MLKNNPHSTLRNRKKTKKTKQIIFLAHIHFMHNDFLDLAARKKLCSTYNKLSELESCC